ncbi:MAG: PVC-type heme-binding CxxCH protein [Acidobacteriota bacterium]
MRRPALVPLFFVGICIFAGIRSSSQQSPQETVQQLHTPPGLEITLWASDPDVINPTNMDIDERGRIWITEAVNYRRQLFKQPDYREKGDRITILEDSDGDGRAEKTKVFVQDPSLRSPLGIAVLGNKVLVSQSPDVIVYTKDENDKILNREVFLTGWGGEDHDHGVHAVVYGPDGYYYFNNGDQGLDVTDRGGRRVTSGPGEKYFAGSALRVRPDGTGLEVIGHNFRNPYELAIDSFGNIWQSDNDDDGNEWVRINYVMEGGNHGFWGPQGRRWREDRGSHFHQEDPGVVPTLLRTGAGSPCGIVVYEGTLLPERYHGGLLHVDNGPRVLRHYEVTPDGAGFRASMEVVVDGSDTWFRPSDLVVAHDGTVFIADWYDPVVGGHQMKDTKRGRIYRLAPPGHRTARPEIDLSTAKGRAEALASPAQSVRYLAHSRFREMGTGSVPELATLVERGDGVLKARALWLLGAAGPNGLEEVLAEVKSVDDRFRLLAVRILKENHPDFASVVQPLLHDSSPQVRRQIALGLRDLSAEQSVGPLLELALQYGGKDRWYLEALAIGAQGKENQLYHRLRQAFSDRWDSRLARLIWVLRPSAAVDFLKSAARDSSLSSSQREEAVEALGVLPSPELGEFLSEIAVSDAPDSVRSKAAGRLIKQLFSLWRGIRQSPEIVPAIRAALQMPGVRLKALDLIGDLGDPQYTDDLLELAESPEASLEVRASALEVIGPLGTPEGDSFLKRLLDQGPLELQMAAVRGMGSSEDHSSHQALQALILSDTANELRSEAVRALGRSEPGQSLLLDLAESGQLPVELQATAVISVNGSRHLQIKQRAQQVLPMFTTAGQELLQNPRGFLLRVQGRTGEGLKVFFGKGQCSVCHSLGEGPEKMGPDLAKIGNKFGSHGLLDAVINPSAGMAPEYTTWILKTRSGEEVRGMIVAGSTEQVTLRDFSGARRNFPKADLSELKRDPVSAMPNLVGVLSEQELADLIAYMGTLK